MRPILFYPAIVIGVLSTIVFACTQYVVKDKDTCRSIAAASKVTYAQLLSWNPTLNVTCENLRDQKDGKVCISNPLGDFALPSNTQPIPTFITTEAPVPSPTGEGTNAHCGEWYKVALGEDCSIIATNQSITRKDLLFLNPQLFDNCTNLQADVYYCVHPVGDISTYPGYDGSSTKPPIKPVPATLVPSPDTPVNNDTSDAQTIPIASGTRLDCYKYTFFTNITDNAAADCWSLSMLMGQSAQDFILWNPSLAESDDAETFAKKTASVANPYAYPCTLSANTSYCVMLASPTTEPDVDIQPPTPLAAGTPANCTRYHQVESYNTCENIMAQYFLDFDQFYSMNPTVGKDCTGLAMGTWYCMSIWPNGHSPPDPDDAGPISTIPTVSGTMSASATNTASFTPSPIQTGMVSNCNSFYKVQGGDGCWAIAHDNNINLDDFYKWNPAVKTDCSGLQPNSYVCIGVQASQTSVSTSATKTSTGGISTPTPTQDGMVKGCKSFYKVKGGDGCWAIANNNKINLDDFYKWNPAVKTDCSGLQPDYNVCIGV